MVSDQDQVERLRAEAIDAYREGDVPKAILQLEQAVEQKTDDAALWELLGTVRLRGSHFHDAIDAFQQAIHINPHRAAAYINIGAIYNRLGEFDLAVDYLQKGIQRDRRSIEGFFNLGTAYRRQKEFKMAISALKEVLRLNSREWDAYYQIGKIYRDQKNLTQEIFYYRKALDIDPGNERVKRSLDDAVKEQQSQQQTESPFGRLVEASYVRQNASTTIMPAMTPAERNQDREIVRLCGMAAERSANELREFIHEEFRQTLDRMKTGVAGGVFHTASFQQIHNDFRKNARELARRREFLQQKLAQLKAHENHVLASLEQKLG